jgi:hypothetical protein
LPPRGSLAVNNYVNKLFLKIIQMYCLPVGLEPEVGEGGPESVRFVCGVWGGGLAECLPEGAGRDAWERVYRLVAGLLLVAGAQLIGRDCPVACWRCVCLCVSPVPGHIVLLWG